jgi:Ca2+-transporting ATPase
MGTLVRNGHGTGIVFATGNSTELGEILSLISDVH